MRISTSMMYDLGVGTVQQQYSDLQKLQEQMGTGRRMLTPADDPIASARALEISQSQSTNEQFTTNGKSANTALSMQESILQQVGDVLHNVQVVAVNAGNPTLNNADRASLATELQDNYDQLLGLANSTDGNGQYLFSGFRGSTLPFSQGASGVVYNGDQGQRLVQISASRQVPISSSGAEVFQLIKNGNGTFVTSAAASNKGTGVVSTGAVLDPTKWATSTSASGYDIVFAVDNGTPTPTITYDIINKTTNVSMITGAASATTANPSTGGARFPRTFTSGQSISFKQLPTDPAPQPAAWDLGVETSITGTPTGTTTVGAYVAGSSDTFNLKPSSQNQDIFSTLQNLINALKNPVGGSSGNTRMTNDLNTALSNLSLAQNNILTVRSTVGASLKEVETQATTNADISLQYSSTLSQLQDLDYTKAISDMALKQAGLDAAQKSFVKVQGLSLFNYITP